MRTCLGVLTITIWMFALSLHGQSPDGKAPAGVSLQDARLSSAFEARVLKDLGSTSLSPDDLRAVRVFSLVRAVNLGPALPSVLRVDGGGESCGATGNCPVLFYQANTHRMLLSAFGWDVSVLPLLHHGAEDIQARNNLSAGEGTLDLYRFDGSVYRHVRTRSETY